LLFTALGEFLLPTGGSAPTSAFIDVLGRLSVEEKASRQALMRTAADGLLASQRQGRRTLWTLSPTAERCRSSCFPPGGAACARQSCSPGGAPSGASRRKPSGAG